MRLKHGISFTVSGLSVYEGINPKNGIIKKGGDKMKKDINHNYNNNDAFYDIFRKCISGKSYKGNN